MRRASIRLVTILGFALLPAVASQAFAPERSAAEAATNASASLIRTIDTSRFSPPSPDPAGITYDPASGNLIFSDSEVDEMSIYRGVNLFQTTLTGSGSSFGVTTAYTIEPTGVSLRASDRTLFVTDDDADRVFVVRGGADGRLGNSDDSVTSFQTTTFGSNDAEDAAYDPETGHLFVVDGLNTQVFRINPGPNGTFGNSDDTFSNFDAGAFGALDPEGIAVDTVRDTLLILDHRTRNVYEVTRAGQLQTVISIAAANSLVAAGITLAPGSTNASTTSMYIVDRGEDNDVAPTENDGKIYEMQVGGGGTSPPPTGPTAPANSPPVVDISTPKNGSRFSTSAPIRFVATAADSENGNLTSQLVWTSNISGQIGTGGDFTRTLPRGHHKITATVTDAAGAAGTDRVNVQVRVRGPKSRSATATTSSTSTTAPSAIAAPTTVSPETTATESSTQPDVSDKDNKGRRKGNK